MSVKFHFAFHVNSLLMFSLLLLQVLVCKIDFPFLIGHYGDVLRVKILFNKKDTALIQFTDAGQASTGKPFFVLSYFSVKYFQESLLI